MKNDEISNVLILGAGTMGLQIGLLCAVSGFKVIIYDPFEQALEEAGSRLKKLAGELVSKGLLEQEKADTGLLRIRFSGDPETAGKDADLVSESVPEDPVLKQ
ncbi:MAG: 3-hydroxyacyl-CoA dehydrogenase NAD-binding domain-containing protein, partial [Pseudomonadota bacterium]|nr:3-hydroxyacyl-CoA dehydrogenase NAD-binding domain-containing protein [Pseudomonadota bacterium]